MKRIYLVIVLLFIGMLSSFASNRNYINYTMSNGSWLLNLYNYVSQDVTVAQQSNGDVHTYYEIMCKDPGWASCKVRKKTEDFSIAWVNIENDIFDIVLANLNSGILSGNISTSNSYNGKVFSYQISWSFNDNGNGSLNVEQVEI